MFYYPLWFMDEYRWLAFLKRDIKAKATYRRDINAWVDMNRILRHAKLCQVEVYSRPTAVDLVNNIVKEAERLCD
jgi:hypothetical protein